jgi:hypothetical protein
MACEPMSTIAPPPDSFIAVATGRSSVGAEDIRLECGAPVIEVRVVQAAEHVLERGHLDQRVDSAEAVLGRLDQRRARVRVGDVRGLGGHALAGRVELGRGRLEGLLGAGGHHDVGPFAEGAGDALATQAAPDAGDDDGLAVEQHG